MIDPPYLDLFNDIKDAISRSYVISYYDAYFTISAYNVTMLQFYYDKFNIQTIQNSILEVGVNDAYDELFQIIKPIIRKHKINDVING